uniref:Uncharacterized protein n=1 Tax=Schistosoma japonicum TaxID=6182 RepID=Q5BYQ7_SCHJA|nr:unknown [Schistosoma japonicum]
MTSRMVLTYGVGNRLPIVFLGLHHLSTLQTTFIFLL